MLRDEIVAYIDAFVASFDPPVLEGVAVRNLRGDDRHGFRIEASDGIHFADQVVVATGGYQVPVVPRCAERLPADIARIHLSLYRNPEQLPPGAVLVVGGGQSGCQIAEDLHLAGRKVHLCVGDAPRVARRYRGKDVVEWLHLMGYYDLPVHEHPLREGVRDKTARSNASAWRLFSRTALALHLGIGPILRRRQRRGIYRRAHQSAPGAWGHRILPSHRQRCCNWHMTM
jgi:putative flavoprotein involved in K+ transport